MYAFKVMTTTLIMILMLIAFYVGLKSKDYAKTAIVVILVVLTMGVIAIWG